MKQKNVYSGRTRKVKKEHRVNSALSVLSGELLEVATHLPKLKFRGFSPWKPSESYTKDEKIAAKLQSFSRKQLQELFQAFFPNLWAEVLNAWEFTGSLRVNAFNAVASLKYPADFPRLKDKQISWLQSMLHLASVLDPDAVRPANLVQLALGRSGFSNRDLGILIASVLSNRDCLSQSLIEELSQHTQTKPLQKVMGLTNVSALVLARNDIANQLALSLLASSDVSEVNGSFANCIDISSPKMVAAILTQLLGIEGGKSKPLSSFYEIRLYVNLLVFPRGRYAQKPLRLAMACLAKLVADDEARQSAWKRIVPETLPQLLLAEGINDVTSMVQKADGLLGSKNAEVRSIAASFLREVGNPIAYEPWGKVLKHADPAVFCYGLAWPYQRWLPSNQKLKVSLFDSISKATKRLQKERASIRRAIPEKYGFNDTVLEFESLVPKYMPNPTIERLVLTGYISDELEVALKNMPSATRQQRAEILSLIRYRSSFAAPAEFQELILRYFALTPFDVDELEQLNPYWEVDESKDLYHLLLKIFLGASDQQAIKTAEWLVNSRKVAYRLKGLEILRTLADTKRSLTSIKRVFDEYQKKIPLPQSYENIHVLDLLKKLSTVRLNRKANDETRSILPTESEPGTPEWLKTTNGSRLAQPTKYSKPTTDQALLIATPAVVAMSKKIQDLGRQLSIQEYESDEKSCRAMNAVIAQIAKRPKDCRDQDGLELARVVWFLKEIPSDVRAFSARSKSRSKWKSLIQFSSKRVEASDYGISDRILCDSTAQELKFHADYKIALISAIPEADFTSSDVIGFRRRCDPGTPWHASHYLMSLLVDRLDDPIVAACFGRYWQAQAWLDSFDENGGISKDYATIAFAVGAASSSDLFLATMKQSRRLSLFDVPKGVQLSGEQAIENYRSAISKLMHDLVAVEFSRTTDTVGEYTGKANEIDELVGIDYVFAILQCQKDLQHSSKKGAPFVSGRSSSKNRLSRVSVRSKLLQSTFPRLPPSKTPRANSERLGLPPDAELKDFAMRWERLCEADSFFEEVHLVQLACLAPQWAWHVERSLNWEGLVEAIYWLRLEEDYGSLNPMMECEGIMSVARKEYEKLPEKLREEDWKTSNETTRVTGMALSHLLARFTNEPVQLKKCKDPNYCIMDIILPSASKGWRKSSSKKLGKERWKIFLEASKCVTPG